MAGDALCILAFELMGKTGNAKAIEVLAHLLGTYGMIGGEMIDIECEGKKVDLEIVDYIHYHKTAALIEASLEVGARLANASEDDIKIIRNYGRSIGLAFQIVDDILDIVSTTEELGKDATPAALSALRSRWWTTFWLSFLRPRSWGRMPVPTSKRVRRRTRRWWASKSPASVRMNCIRNRSRLWMASSAIPRSCAPLPHSSLPGLNNGP